MPKGGARTRSGPPPDPNALRRERDQGEWSILPPEGREDPAPDWPLPGHSDREAEIWAEMWAKPQALMWERYDMRFEVALYVRNLTVAELPGSAVNLGTLVRQQADSLGLTVPGMRANRWRIGPIVPAEVPAEDKPAQASSRARLTVVAGGPAA